MENIQNLIKKREQKNIIECKYNCDTLNSNPLSNYLAINYDVFVLTQSFGLSDWSFPKFCRRNKSSRQISKKKLFDKFVHFPNLHSLIF